MDALTLQTLFPAPESECTDPPPYSAHLARDSAVPSHAGLNSLAPTDAKGSQPYLIFVIFFTQTKILDRKFYKLR